MQMLYQEMLLVVAMAWCCQGVAMGNGWSLLMRSPPDQQKKLVMTGCHGSTCCWRRVKVHRLQRQQIS